MFCCNGLAFSPDRLAIKGINHTEYLFSWWRAIFSHGKWERPKVCKRI